MGNFIDLSGQKFNRLAVIRRTENSPENTAQFLCLCDCGRECVVRSSFLKGGHTKSCGCLKIELTKKRNETIARHGHCCGRNSSTYQIWANMWYRCTSPRFFAYERYGGRGIKVCERWKIFDNFLADMGPRPHGLSIDRKDNDGDYCPENCHWITMKQQARNRKSNRMILYKGETKCVLEWAGIVGLGYGTITRRIDSGWPIELSMTKPARITNRKLTSAEL